MVVDFQEHDKLRKNAKQHQDMYHKPVLRKKKNQGQINKHKRKKKQQKLTLETHTGNKSQNYFRKGLLKTKKCTKK